MGWLEAYFYLINTKRQWMVRHPIVGGIVVATVKFNPCEACRN